MVFMHYDYFIIIYVTCNNSFSDVQATLDVHIVIISDNPFITDY